MKDNELKNEDKGNASQNVKYEHKYGTKESDTKRIDAFFFSRARTITDY